MNSVVTESKLTLLAIRQANKLGDKVLRQGITTLLRKPADQENGGLAFPKKHPSYQSLDTNLFYRTVRGRK